MSRFLNRESSHPTSFLQKSCGAVLGTMLLLASLSAPAVTPQEWTTLSSGKVVVSNSRDIGTASAVQGKILIPRPPSQVWTVVSDPQRLMKTEQKVKQVKYLSKTPTSQKVEFTVLMTRLFPAFNYVLRQDLVAPQKVSFQRLSGSFKDIRGSWLLTPVENGTQTILTYTLQLDPGPMIPKNLLMGAVKSDLPSMLLNAKRAIEGQ